MLLNFIGLVIDLVVLNFMYLVIELVYNIRALFSLKSLFLGYEVLYNLFL